MNRAEPALFERRGPSTLPLVRGPLPTGSHYARRVADTIDAIPREPGRDGFVSRYSTAVTEDGLSGDEGRFLARSFCSKAAA